MPVPMVNVFDTVSGLELGDRPREWLDIFPHLREISDSEAAQQELRKLTVPELKELADKLGLDVTGLTRKAEIVAAVQEHRPPSGDAADDENGEH